MNDGYEDEYISEELAKEARAVAESRADLRKFISALDAEIKVKQREVNRGLVNLMCRRTVLEMKLEDVC